MINVRVRVCPLAPSRRVRVVTRRVKWVLRGGTKWVRSGSVCSIEARQVGVYRAFCHLPWGPFCRPSCDVSKTINIITYTDV